MTWSGIVSTDSMAVPFIFNAINEILAKKGKKKIHWI